MLVKTYFEDRQMEGSGKLEASSLPCFETVSSAKNWEEEAFIWKTGDWELDLQQTLCGFEDEKATTDKKIEEWEQTGGLNHAFFILPFLSVGSGDHQHMHCFLSVYPATNGFAGTWDLRSNYHVSLIGAPIIPLFTPNTLVHNKQGKALILFLRRVDYPIHMEVVLYYCCVNCSISNNGKFECIQTLLVVIVHLIGLSNTLRFWWGHGQVYCVWVTICWRKLNSLCFSLHLIYFLSAIFLILLMLLNQTIPIAF